MSIHLSGAAVAKLSELLDEFKCHPNNMGVLRWWYREIMAKLAESTLLDYVFSEIWGEEVGYQKLSDQLPALIRNSRYAIC